MDNWPRNVLALKLFQACMNFFQLLNTKEDILVSKQLLVAIDFHCMEKVLWKSMATVNF